MKKLALGFLIGLVACSSPSSTVQPFGIYYSASGNTSVIQADGSGNKKVLDNTGFISARGDGKKIVYDKVVAGAQNIFIANPDASEEKQLTNATGGNFRAVLSFDGSKIVFVSSRDGNREVYIMNADGSNQTRLTNRAGDDTFPAISRDNSKVLYTQYTASDQNLRIINADGSGDLPLTSNTGFTGTGGFSPDGSRIVFSRGEPSTLLTMKPDGSDVKPLPSPTGAVHPSYSTDGQKISYYVAASGDRDLYVANADGSNPVNITNTPSISENKVSTWWQ